jgi:hypothetical protein
VAKKGSGNKSSGGASPGKRRVTKERAALKDLEAKKGRPVRGGLSLNYGGIKPTYTPQKPDGSG